MAQNAIGSSPNKKRWNISIPQTILILVVLWFIFTFLIYPNFVILRDTFWVDGQFSTEAVSKIMRSNRALDSIRNSFVLAIVLTFTVNIVGIFIVFATEYFDVKGSKLLRIGFMSTLVFSGMVLNNGYLYVYGSEGVLTQTLLGIFPNMDPNWFNGFPAVLFVMTFACTSNHMLFLRNAVKGLDYNMIEAARNLGSGQWEIIQKIVLPSLKPVILTLIIMTFQIGLGALSAPVMVGGRDFQTIAPLILNFVQRPASRDIAALLSIVLGLAQIALLVVMTINEKRGNYLSISKTKTRITKQKIDNPVANVVVHIISYVLFVIYTLPLILVVLFSFMDTQAITLSRLSLSSFTLEHYTSILTNPDSYQPLVTSIIYSGSAAVIAVLFMLVVARLVMSNKGKKFIESLEFAFYIPWLLPALMTALGLILAYSAPNILLFNQSVVGTLWVLPLAYMIMMLPTSLRYIKSAYYSFDTNLENAAQTLGASSIRTFFTIILPALLPTALALIALNFNGYLADYDLSAFLYHPRFATLGVMIRSNADATNVDAKAINLVYSVILMVVGTLIFYFIYGRGTSLASSTGGITEDTK